MPATPATRRFRRARSVTASGLASLVAGAALVAGSFLPTAAASEPVNVVCERLQELLDEGDLPIDVFESQCGEKSKKSKKSYPTYPPDDKYPTPEPTPTPTPEPTPTPTPEPEPEIELAILEPVCDDDVPYLEYFIDATGFEPTDVRMTWINPTGDDVVYENLPLAARVLWAGAVVDEDGNPLDWPGWIQQPDGTWVQGDDGFEWVRPSVEILFEVNADVSVTVDYPPSSPDCDANPPSADEPRPELPETGLNTNAWLALGGSLLMLAGFGLVLYGRRFLRGRA